MKYLYQHFQTRRENYLNVILTSLSFLDFPRISIFKFLKISKFLFSKIITIYVDKTNDIYPCSFGSI